MTYFQSLTATALRRVMREITDLKKSPPEGIRIQMSEEDLLDITGIIQGPGKCMEQNLASLHGASLSTSVWWLTKLDLALTEGTPYAGGYFKVKCKFTEEFPAAPPKCKSR